jgi:beta-lactamase class A
MNSNPLFNLLPQIGEKYAFYLRRDGELPCFQSNADRFSSASMIKIPILLAWAALERAGEISLDEPCDLDLEPQVKGAGFARQFKTRNLSYHDILLMMITTSDNLCSNLAIQRVGMERLNTIFKTDLGLTGTELQRKFMDFAARERGLDNWISAQDYIHLYDVIRTLPVEQQSWIKPMLLNCQDSSLLMRNLERDSVHFYHKTGSIPGVLHDWGFTRACDIFLFSNGVHNETQANQIFGLAGELMRPSQSMGV